MERDLENKLQEVVKLYFKGFSVSDALKKVREENGRELDGIVPNNCKPKAKCC